MKGMLVTFEGQDGSGKSTLLKLVNARLIQDGILTLMVPEFSSNVLGEFLKDVLSQNKFLRLNNAGPSAMTETMYVLSDLYSQDELEIRPALQQGFVVVKERHLDSILACQIHKIIDDYPSSDTKQLFQWLSHACAQLTEPDLTLFLRVREKVLRKRIGARGEQATENDFVIFKRRQAIYDCLASKNQHRWFEVPNDNDIDKVVQIIINEVNRRLSIR